MFSCSVAYSVQVAMFTVMHHNPSEYLSEVSCSLI